MNTSNYQLSATEEASLSLDLETTFAIRFSAVMLLTLFSAGYIWTLAITYPAMALLPVLFITASLTGHFIMATQLITRLQTLDDNSKNKALVWFPFIGLAYALPAVMIVNDSAARYSDSEYSTAGTKAETEAA